MSNEYAAILKESPQPSYVSPSIQELRNFCDGITEHVHPRGKCELERGYLVDYGQEFRVTLIRSEDQYKVILLRAYVPVKSLPVLLDTYAEEMITCKSVKELKAELGKFLRMENVQSQIHEWVR